MRRALAFGCSLWLGSTLACGGIARVEDDGSGGSSSTGETRLDPCADVQMDGDFGVVDCSTKEQCVMYGELEGKPVRQECNATRCVLFVDEVLACTCAPELIDWSNACASGLPTCASWKFNFVEARFCK